MPRFPHWLTSNLIAQAGQRALDDNVNQVAQAIGYNSFLAIPSVLLVAVGAVGIVASQDDITSMLEQSDFLPPDVVRLVSQSLTQLSATRSGSVVILLVGLVIALWSLTGSMQTLMWGLNAAFRRDETRSFARRRITALVMVLFTVAAAGIVFALFVLGPRASDWVATQSGHHDLAERIWSVAQWPVVAFALLFLFAMTMRLGPNLPRPRFSIFTVGGVTAVIAWLILSDAFAYFTSRFGSYNKTWGSLAAVIVVMVWLRLSALVLLLGAEIDAERDERRAQSPTGGAS